MFAHNTTSLEAVSYKKLILSMINDTEHYGGIKINKNGSTLKNSKRPGVLAVIFVFVMFLTSGCKPQKKPAVLFSAANGVKGSAVEYLKRENYDFAQFLYKKALNMFKNIKEKYPKWEQTDILLDTAITECENGIRVTNLYLRKISANSFFMNDRYKDAIQEWSNIITEYRKDQREQAVLLQLSIGYTYFLIGEFNKALEAFEIVLKDYKEPLLRKYCALALNWIGQIYSEIGKYDEALNASITVLTEYNEQKQNCAEAQNFIGIVYYKQGNYEKAKEAFQKTKKDYSGLFNRITAQFMLGDIPVEEFEETSLAENHLEALYIIGYKFELDGRFLEAEGYYKKFLEVTIDTRGFMYKLAQRKIAKIGQ